MFLTSLELKSIKQKAEDLPSNERCISDGIVCQGDPSRNFQEGNGNSQNEEGECEAPSGKEVELALLEEHWQTSDHQCKISVSVEQRVSQAEKLCGVE